MGLGPPICNHCKILLIVDYDRYGQVWECPGCKIEEESITSSGLWEYDEIEQEYINNRSILYKERKIVFDDLVVAASSRRKFPTDSDPNDSIRPWLEEHIGKQSIDWNWDLCPKDMKLIEFYFAKTEHAVLFELSW